jgi:hypothetical protein
MSRLTQNLYRVPREHLDLPRCSIQDCEAVSCRGIERRHIRMFVWLDESMTWKLGTGLNQAGFFVAR